MPALDPPRTAPNLLSSPSDPTEREADSIAAEIASGPLASPKSRSRRPEALIQRQIETALAAAEVGLAATSIVVDAFGDTHDWPKWQSDQISYPASLQLVSARETEPIAVPQVRFYSRGGNRIRS
jgi:hypothetical protein